MGQQLVPKWILVRTQPRREEWAAENVVRQGHECYLPKIAVRVQRGKSKRQAFLVVKPLFPRYLFVRVYGPWSFLMSTFGVTGVVLTGENPTIVPDHVITDIKSREDTDGRIVLPKRQRLVVDEKVRVTKGPFEKQVGIYQGSADSERERVLLDFLGGKRMTLIRSTDVEPY